MIRLFARFTPLLMTLASVTFTACSGNSTTPTTPTTATSPAPTTTTTTKPSLSAPVPVTPLSGTTVGARPTLTVVNAARTGTVTGTVTYTFDIADNPGFAPVAATGSAQEGTGVTSFTVTGDLQGGKAYYWRAAAVDVADGVTSPASSAQTISTIALTLAAKIAGQEGLTLWPGVQPPGIPGQTALGPGWSVTATSDFLGNPYQSPTLENLRVLDLLDRGMNANSVISWMNSNGYGTNAVYYGDVAQGVFGFSQNYMTLIGTSWELVRRVGA